MINIKKKIYKGNTIIYIGQSRNAIIDMKKKIYKGCFGHTEFKLCRLFLGEGNGTPLQYSCLENPMDGGAWKAAVHGVAEGRT